MQNKNTFTEGKILSPLLKFAIPILFAIFLQAMYGAVDLLVVGQFGSATDVSAVATGSQIMQTITSIISGIAMGTTIILGQKLGERKEEEAGEVVGTSIFIFVIIGILITAIMFVAAKPFSVLLQAPPEAFDKTVQYVLICSTGAIFIVAYNVTGSIFRGMGNSKMPLITVAIACVVNIVLDLVFVAIFHMETAGAALATVIAQAVSVVLSIIIIKKQGLPFKFHKKDIKCCPKYVKAILKMGSPIALQDALVSISFLAITAVINSMGLIASAGVGVAEKLCMFIMLVPSAFMQAMSAFVAQNIGARQFKRAKKAMGYGMLISFVVGGVMGYLSFFHGEILSAIFAKDPKVILASADYLRAYAIDCLLVSFLFCFMGYFNGCGKTLFVMTQGIIGAFLVRIPFSYLMSKTAGVTLFRVGLATPASTVVQIILCVIYFALLNKEFSIRGKDNSYSITN